MDFLFFSLAVHIFTVWDQVPVHSCTEWEAPGGRLGGTRWPFIALQCGSLQVAIQSFTVWEAPGGHIALQCGRHKVAIHSFTVWEAPKVDSSVKIGTSSRANSPRASAVPIFAYSSVIPPIPGQPGPGLESDVTRPLSPPQSRNGARLVPTRAILGTVGR